MRVFVNDLTGYVGAAVAKALLGEGHEVVGTVASGPLEYGTTEGITETAPAEDTAAVEQLVLSCETVVISLFQQLRECLSITKLLKQKFEGEKTLIVLSSVLTWGRTPLPAEEDEGFKEENFTQRRPFERYNNFKVVETQALSIARNNLKTIVVGCGVLYGDGESSLASLFKTCWLCETPSIGIPDFGGKKGGNIIPMLHVRDLSQLVFRLMESPPEKSYVVAVDKGRVTLRALLTRLSETLGLGVVHDLSREESGSLMARDLALATVLYCDLRFDTGGGGGDGGSAVEELALEWHAEEGILEHMPSVVAEYKAKRDLRPLRVALLGPPGVGKSFYAAALARQYYLPTVGARDAIAYARQLPTELGEELREALRDPTSRLSAGQLARCFRARLLSRACQNKGFVLDGYPRSHEDAVLLFGRGEGEEGEEGGDGDGEEGEEAQPDSRLLPRSVIILDGSDKFLKARVMSLPEEDVVGTHNDEAGFTRRLKLYRENTRDTRDATPAVFFEAGAGVETLGLNVSDGVFSEGVKGEDSVLHTPAMTAATLDTLTTYVETGAGKPFNFHPTPEEEAAALAAAEEEEKAARDAEVSASAEQERAERRVRQRREEAESKRLAEVERQEKALLEARSLPLRNYLMRHVIPTLTEGLIETCKVMPEDPVDYLAEFLFKHSPETDD